MQKNEKRPCETFYPEISKISRSDSFKKRKVVAMNSSSNQTTVLNLVS